MRADASRELARAEGFDAAAIEEADRADIVCLLVPDDVIPRLPLRRRAGAQTIVASGYSLAFDRLQVEGDLAMIAPRMLGPEVRLCYEEGAGFITALGVQRDASGRGLARTLALASALGGLKQGAIGLSPKQEAVLDLAVEQLLSPALTHVNQSFVRTLLAHGIPLEAILTELVLSGEVERSYRLLREKGYAFQMDFHSPTSQYGQLSRRGAYDHLDVATKMEEMLTHIEAGAFADEWDAESAEGAPLLQKLKQQHCGPAILAFESEIRQRLGPGAAQRRNGAKRGA